MVRSRCHRRGVVVTDQEQGELEPIEWSQDINVMVTIRVNAKSNPEFYEGLGGRTPLDLAISAGWRAGLGNLGNVDGWADMLGDADVIDVQEGF